jgi:hypothetical protein
MTELKFYKIKACSYFNGLMLTSFNLQFEGVSYIDALDAWDPPPPALEIAPPSLRLLHITDAHSFIVRSGLLSHSNWKCPDIVTVSAHDARSTHANYKHARAT